LEIVDKDLPSLRAKAGEGFKTLIIATARGTVPAGKESDAKSYKAHASTWFKSLAGGRELADKLFELDAWPALKPHLLPFCNGVRAAVDLPALADLP
jgi:putative ATP-dependent endonuclease of OLD family